MTIVDHPPVAELTGYQLIQLGEVTSRAASVDPKKKFLDAFTYIDLSSVDQAQKKVSDTKNLEPSEAPSRARQVVQTSDVLVSTVRPNLNGVAVVPKVLDGSIASTGFTVLRPDASKILPTYLFQWVKSPRFIDDMISKATGASYPAVSDKIVRESTIPLPPLPEQRRIAAILDKADHLRTQRREALAHLDALTQSMFNSMFGNLDPEKTGWPILPIGEVCDAIVDCVNRTAPLADAPTPYKMIRTSNVRNRSIDLTSVRYVDEHTFVTWNRRAVPSHGDVVLTREAPMGEAGIIPPGEQVFLGQRTMLYRPDPDISTAEFLLHYLTGEHMHREYLRNGSGTTVKHLSVPYCRTLDVAVPPLELQQSFARRVAGVERLKEQHRTQLAQLDTLFASLQHRAFSGQL
ncbi:restriction endonuclease subunit S [Arthrobacter sp. STN4]|uniref:restriction endonuclease subunit S n=1 Tax=Arthrobacter sp. STN4 TaxID=2923276 RepID=UPI00211A1575|nr:restriction endonuclease subunit S [Arthrobacter sp. STN4]MCQ9163908.1 restriction endonuclease subunit S [Arthrobacter sp. STN4]